MIITIPTSVSAQDEGTIIINTNLVNGATYDGIIEISVTASHPDGIWYITVNIDGSNVQSEYSSSLIHSWDTTLYSDGAHHIQIRSAVNATFFRSIDFDVFVDNTPETTTTETTTTETTTTAPTMTEGILSGTTGLLLVAFVGVGVLAAIGYSINKRSSKVSEITPGAKVLVICPYCGSKTEQGLTICQKCGADL